jgi:hypothetical protein
MGDESKRAHMEMVQGVVSRMAQNSSANKGWAVALVSGLYALAAAGSNVKFAYVAYLPSVMFWYLDAYYLRQERLFRKLYDHVRGTADDKVDYSMNTQPFAAAVDSLPKVMLSGTLAPFYGVLLITTVVVSAFAK